MGDRLIFHTEHLQMKILDESAAAAVLDYYRRNRDFHQTWFASRPDDIFTIKQQRANLAAEFSDFQSGRAVPFWLSLQSDPKRIIGRIAFTNIIRGCFNSCFVAYHLDQECQGAGLAREAGQAAIPIMFNDFDLHRVEANIMPANNRSIALAESLGFKLEGLSPKYLKINGKWEDHLHYVLLADEQDHDEESIELTTGYLLIRPIRQADIPAAVDYYQRNQDFLSTWNPVPDKEMATAAGWRRQLTMALQEQATAQRLDFGIFLIDRPDRLVGIIECRAIRPLPYSSCEIGFSIDRLLSGRGLMVNALSTVISHLFSRFGLQRINASCCTDHARSFRILEMLGFSQEGIARKSLFLHDQWHDLVNLALIKENFHPNENVD